MSLQNLVGRSLETVAPDRAAIARLLAAAERNLADAQLAGLSAETRFDASYKAIMQCAMAALQANGYPLIITLSWSVHDRHNHAQFAVFLLFDGDHNPHCVACILMR